MKQLKIIVALVAGLFAFTSANAGEMTVSGTMQATYQSEVDAVTGNPLGMNTDLKFVGSTEVLDGTAVTWTLATDGTFLGDSSADHTLKFASPYGTFKVGNAGDSANAVDDITPSAFEEANGSGSGAYATDFGSGMEGSMSVGYAKSDIMGTGISFDYTYYPNLDGSTNNEKAATGSTAAGAAANSAQSANVKIDMSALPAIGGELAGLVVTLGYEESDASVNTMQGKEGATVAVNYATGPVKVGYQKKAYQPETTTIAAKEFYKDDIIGIAYAINDSLAVSYNVIESVKHAEAGIDVEQKTKAINAAYTIGGLTIGFQDAKTSHSGYVTDTDNDTRTLSLKTAF